MPKIPLFMLLTAWLLLLLTACSVQTATNSPLTFAISGDTAELDAYEKLVAAFQVNHPEITIELQHIPGDSEYRQRLASSFSAGTPPDIFLLNYRRFAQFAAQDGLEPVGQYLADSQVIQADDFFAPVIDAFTWDGQLWCIPQNVSSLVVYYNRDLFTAAGLPLPTNDWEWETFLHAARTLTQDIDGDGTLDQYGVGIEPSLFRLAPFVWGNGGDIVDNLATPTRLTLDTPESLAAFQQFVDMQVVEHIVPDAVAESAEDSETRFLNGRLAMYFNSRRGVPTYRTITSFTWDVAPLPRAAQATGILHSDGYCLAAATANKAAAWRFIEFANSVAGQTIMAETGRTVPSLRQVAASPAFLTPTLPPANSQIFIDNMAVIRRVPIMKSWISIEETANQEIERAFFGQVSIAEAAATAISLTQSYFPPTP